MCCDCVTGGREVGDGGGAAQNGRRAAEAAKRAGQARQGGAEEDPRQEQLAAQVIVLPKTGRLVKGEKFFDSRR